MAGSVQIVRMTDAHRRDARRLVDAVFPSQGLLERLSLSVVDSRLAGLLRLFGIESGRFWVALSGGRTVGTTGLYTIKGDAADRCWLGWFCVDPSFRGQGLGKQLLDFATSVAGSEGRRKLRLYTSTDPREAAAQHLYERESFQLIGVEQPLLWRITGTKKLIRERALQIP